MSIIIHLDPNQNTEPNCGVKKALVIQQHLTANNALHGMPETSELNSILSSNGNVDTLSTYLGKRLIPWIIETGATHHITYSLSNFYNYETIAHFILKMPNG